MKDNKRKGRESSYFLYQEFVFPKDVFKVPVYIDLIAAYMRARPSTKRRIKYIVIHETDNFEKGVEAKNHATYLKYNNDSST